MQNGPRGRGPFHVRISPPSVALPLGARDPRAVAPFPHGDGAAMGPSIGDHDTVAVTAGCPDPDSWAVPAADAYVDISLCEQFRPAAAQPSARQPPSRL